jgi:acyl carrier protein
MVQKALVAATGKKSVQFSGETHLVESGVLDSLDSSVFLLELEKASGSKITDQDVEKNNLFKVSNMVAWLCK